MAVSICLHLPQVAAEKQPPFCQAGGGGGIRRLGGGRKGGKRGCGQRRGGGATDEQWARGIGRKGGLECFGKRGETAKWADHNEQNSPSGRLGNPKRGRNGSWSRGIDGHGQGS